MWRSTSPAAPSSAPARCRAGPGPAGWRDGTAGRRRAGSRHEQRIIRPARALPAGRARRRLPPAPVADPPASLPGRRAPHRPGRRHGRPRRRRPRAGPGPVRLIALRRDRAPGRGRRRLQRVRPRSLPAPRGRRAEADARLERDIHDGPQQRLVRLGMGLARAKRQTSRDPRAAETILDGAIAQTRETSTSCAASRAATPRRCWSTGGWPRRWRRSRRAANWSWIPTSWPRSCGAGGATTPSSPSRPASGTLGGSL